jgi:hypothetical protein
MKSRGAGPGKLFSFMSLGFAVNLLVCSSSIRFDIYSQIARPWFLFHKGKVGIYRAILRNIDTLKRKLIPMKQNMIRCTLVGLFLLLLAGTFAETLQAQDLHPSRRPSPLGVAQAHLGDTYVKIVYGRPYKRNREVFGTLVPYGELWRTGANEATEIILTGPVMVAGERLDAGVYSIFTTPGASSWRIHFSPQLGLDGTGQINRKTGEFIADVYDSARDVLVVEVDSESIGEESEVVEQFTIDIDPDAGQIVISWDRTMARIPIAAAM